MFKAEWILIGGLLYSVWKYLPWDEAAALTAASTVLLIWRGVEAWREGEDE